MAPESERAKCPNCGGAKNAPVFRETPEEDTVCVHKFHAPGCPSCGSTDHYRDIGSDCAPATCSEVVERLQKCAFIRYERDGSSEAFIDEGQAEMILTEWRERRVQELEEALTRYGSHDSLCNARRYVDRTDCNCGFTNATNSEWREQIRKGAKHE